MFNVRVRNSTPLLIAIWLTMLSDTNSTVLLIAIIELINSMCYSQFCTLMNLEREKLAAFLSKVSPNQQLTHTGWEQQLTQKFASGSTSHSYPHQKTNFIRSRPRSDKRVWHALSGCIWQVYDTFTSSCNDYGNPLECKLKLDLTLKGVRIRDKPNAVNSLLQITPLILMQS